jgi:hypothetical protein
MWVGRATVFLVGLAVILALVVGIASTAFGANGQAWILGQINKATNTTRLTGDVPGGAGLQVSNFRTAAGSKALQLNVADRKAPLAVNASAGKAVNLNADKVDGKDATGFAGTGKSVYRGGSTFCDVPQVLSIPFSVSREALVYTSANASLSANGNAGTSAIMKVELRDGTNSSTLAQAGFGSWAYTANATDRRSMDVSGVLKTGISSPSEAPFVAVPGQNYVLRLVVSLNGGTCTGSSALLDTSSLSYILLGKP